MMIDKTKELVEEKYTIANGYDHDAKVSKCLKNTSIRELTLVVNIMLVNYIILHKLFTIFICLWGWFCNKIETLQVIYGKR